jgi:Zn-dependent peptidase ImmA (M78 family)
VRRGFKAEAERLSDRVRAELGLASIDALPLDRLARTLAAELRSAGDLIDVARLEEIDRLQPGAFSACTFEIDDRHVIVWNPLSSPGRRNSDIAHELSHLLLSHAVKEVHRVGDLTFFGCDPDEEQEANWLAGCLLLPRSLLVPVLRRGATADVIAERYDVSVQMANYRIRATGAQRQVRRS